MSFAFRRRDADLTAGLRRIAATEIAAALAQLDPGPPDAAGVHDLRKRIKKLRGLLRLVRPGMARATDEIAVLRDAARGLSPVRDAEVMLMWHDRLAPGADGPLRAMLAARVETARAGADLPGAAEAARTALQGVAERVPEWRVKGKGAAVLKASLARSLRRGASAMQEARATREVEALHDWRKRAKDLWYQTRLLSPVWPDAVAVWQSLADDLGEWLGEHHDLAVFQALTADAEGAAGTEAMAVRAQARLMSSEIEAKVFEAGGRLYAADPDAVAGIIVDWWRVWREG
ncbi:MAG: CHAD domain-containing protein [Paracoccaceae bacterium]|nr:MAG: CHAD domain-containing protein [Paracoccaceae bacterium]